MTPPKAKDGRETLQERRMSVSEAKSLGYTVDETVNPILAYKGPRFRPTEYILVISDELAAAQAEIARLESDNTRLRMKLLAAEFDANIPADVRTPLPVAEDVVERAARAVCIARGLNPITLHQNYDDSEPVDAVKNFGNGEVKLHFGWRNQVEIVNAVLSVVSLLRQPAETESLSERREENEATGNTASEGISPSASRPVSGRSDDPSHEADTHAANVSLGVTAGETAPSRQPEAAPEGLIRNAALQEAAAHLRDLGYWTQGAAVLSLCTDASTPAPASARSSATTTAPPVSLAECPVGLFTYRGTLCLKSEYGDNSGRIDAYIVSSGEFFWGGTQTASDQRKLFVTPAPDLLVSLQIAVGHIEHMAAFITTMNRKHNAGYSFESLGEDMPDIRSLLSAISGGRE